MFRTNGSNKWQEMEIHHAKSLEAAYTKLTLDSISYESNVQDGLHFLTQLEGFADLLKVKAVTREYRTTFTKNYRRFFRDHGRQYRFELLQAICDACPAMHINGCQHLFSDKVVELSRKPKALMNDLVVCLQKCKFRDSDSIRSRPAKSEVITLLGLLDDAWANFECQYIKELISMEAAARNPLKVAVKHAKHIPMKNEDCSWQSWGAKLEQFREHKKMLFERIAELNATANISRKGRDDLSVNALNVAVNVVTSGIGYENSSHLVRSVCEDLLESFAAMCKYLCTVENAMESVDPILRNNAGLVERLADLEEAWEVVDRYIKDGAMRCTLDAVFGTLQRTQELAPEFQEMCSDCDVELFLVIPRLVLLAFLMNPGKDALLKLLLPHSLEDSGAQADLHNLFFQFESIVVDQPAVVDTLLFLAVRGPGEVEKIVKEHQGVIRTFVRELERWSLELQRHQANDWNTFCAVLVQHLSNDCKKDRKVSKHV